MFIGTSPFLIVSLNSASAKVTYEKVAHCGLQITQDDLKNMAAGFVTKVLKGDMKVTLGFMGFPPRQITHYDDPLTVPVERMRGCSRGRSHGLTPTRLIPSL
ncbi:hypothetical protein CEXT_329391 [Caerostris extrusa]|uniref:Uncharacterized protein n=1 Tax=Caerostris extrusa TaxID=172846 RepID=A0AAV4R4W2_CAEEX|nr:hypothetical protein CEXT_329391 [Caerostris extrusa]